jgi:hypothetical protein
VACRVVYTCQLLYDSQYPVALESQRLSRLSNLAVTCEPNSDLQQKVGGSSVLPPVTLRGQAGKAAGA